MKTKCSLFLLLTVLFTNNSFVFGDSLEELVPVYADRLRNGEGAIIETQLKNPEPKLLPEDSEMRGVVNGIMKSLDPSVLVEVLFVYKKPAAYSEDGAWDTAQKTDIFNQLIAISSLAGIQYYSASRGTMRTFFETSQVIDDPGTKKPLSDPVYETPPQTVSLFARQKDLTFGDNVYNYAYNVNSNCIYFLQENVTALTVGIIPVVRKGNLRTILAVFDCGDSLLIYAASMAKAASVPGMGDRVTNSLSNRAEAMLNWFTTRADLVYN